jgi:hypothetical protein
MVTRWMPATTSDPLLDAEQRSVARFVRTALPVPLSLGVALAAVALVVQLS